MSIPSDLASVLQQHLQDLLDIDQESRLNTKPGRPLYTVVLTGDIDTDPVDADLEVIEDLIGEARERLARRQVDTVSRVVDALMKQHGLPEETRATLALGVLAAEVKALEKSRERLLGRDVGDYFPPTVGSTTHLTPTPSGPQFSKFAEDYIDYSLGAREIRANTVGQHRQTYVLFQQVCGDKPIDAYTRKETGQFYETLRKLPAMYGKAARWRGLSLTEIVERSQSEGFERLTPKTLSRHMSSIGGLFSRAITLGLYERTNPAYGFAETRKQRASSARQMWEGEPLTKLFLSPVWAGSHKRFRSRPGPHIIRDGKFWLPILGLFHGNRLEEFSQLHREDIRHADGVWFFDITDGDGRQLKNDQSKRRVPIHPEVMKIGFLGYVASLPPEPKALVFPDLIPGGLDNKLGYYFTKWWTHYRKSVGVYENKLDYHSFRHGVTTRLFNAGVQPTLVDELTGHESKGTAASTYYKGAPLRDLLNAISRVAWPEVDFSPLYVAANALIQSDTGRG